MLIILKNKEFAQKKDSKKKRKLNFSLQIPSKFKKLSFSTFFESSDYKCLKNNCKQLYCYCEHWKLEYTEFTLFPKGIVSQTRSARWSREKRCRVARAIRAGFSSGAVLSWTKIKLGDVMVLTPWLVGISCKSESCSRLSTSK